MNEKKDRIEKLTRDMKKMSVSMNRGSTMLLVVALILFAVSLGYFIFGYTQFRDVTKPENLMLTAEAVVSDNIKIIRRNLQVEVEKNSDAWAEQLSNAAIDTVPKMRNQLEDFVSAQIDQRVKQSIELSDPEFEKFISENNQPLKKAFADLAKNDEVSEELVALITQEVDDRLKTSIEADAKNVLNMMIQLKTKLRRLEKGNSLSDEEKLEREIFATARFIQDSK